MNHRPDFQSWIRMINTWNKESFNFYDAFSTDNPDVFTRVATDPRVTIKKMNTSTEGRSTLMGTIKGTGKTDKAKKRSSAKVLIDVFVNGPSPEVNVFVKARTMEGMERALLLVHGSDLDEELADLLSTIPGNSEDSEMG